MPKEVPVPKAMRVSWVAHIMSLFKQSGYVALAFSSRGIRYFFNKADIPRRIASHERLLYNNDQCVVFDYVKNKVVDTGPPERFIHPYEHFVSTGYMNHPAVIMWLGYENALADYINAHIDVWIARGYKNTMSYVDVVYPVIKPFWLDYNIIKMFQSALLQRELIRNEPPWYIFLIEFINSFAEVTTTVNHIIKLIQDGYLNQQQYILQFSKFTGLVWP